MNNNVWKLPHPNKVFTDTRQFISRHKKAVIGIAGIASIAAVLYYSGRKDDTPLFEQSLVKMNAVEEHAVQQMSKLQYVQDMEQAAEILADSTLPDWKKFKQELDATKNMKLDKSLAEKRKLLVEYADLRVQQAGLLYKAFKGNTNAYDQDLQRVYNKINQVLNQLQH